MSDWYLIQTKPRQETVAQQNLSLQGYKVYCPLFIIKDIARPLFPRYLFITVDNKTKNLSPVRSTKGVSNFVRFGSDFAIVRNSIIQEIKKREKSSINKAIDQSKFHKGDKVQINHGVFQGNEAIFEKYKDEDRVILLLKVLQQEQSIQFSNDQFQSI